MKIIQIELNPNYETWDEHRDILRAAGVQRIHRGWYTVLYNGVDLDASNVVQAKRNPKGEIKH